MNLVLNAWIEKRKPELTLVDIDSNNIVACWKGRALECLFSSGAISYLELVNPNKKQLNQLIKELFLQLACEERCGPCLFA